jgi:hypothetical protein
MYYFLKTKTKKGIECTKKETDEKYPFQCTKCKANIKISTPDFKCTGVVSEELKNCL